MDLESFRRDYLRGGLQREEMPADPLDKFREWMQQALELDFSDPTAMTVATVGTDGQPSQRIVLLKQFDERGFVFYSNYGSRKAKELEVNPRVSLHFPWHDVDRQVKICGVAEKLTAAESLKYFLSRPRASQIAAHASSQSQVLSSKTMLLNQFESLKQKFHAGEVPLPDFWGGYRVTPHEIEFWQGGADRLHDRFHYRRDGDSWEINRLAP